MLYLVTDVEALVKTSSREHGVPAAQQQSL